MSRPSIKQLEYFVTLARCGSFRRAADELNISQPTITAQIARIERALGVVLFERGRSGAVLTPAGRQLLPLARSVLEELDQLLLAAGSAGSGAATYRMGVKTTLGPYLLPRILPSIHGLHQDLRLYVREASSLQLETLLESGELDLGLTSFPTNSAEITGEPLLREAIRLVLPAEHPLAQRPSVRGEDLAGERILTTEEGHHFTRQVEQVASRFGAVLQRDYQGTSLDALRLMTMMGMGIAFLPALYIDSEIKADTALVVKEVEGETIARIVGLAWRHRSPARAFYRRLARDMRSVLERELGGIVQVLTR